VGKRGGGEGKEGERTSLDTYLIQYDKQDPEPRGLHVQRQAP
jgi:hypothetical protein